MEAGISTAPALRDTPPDDQRRAGFLPFRRPLPRELSRGRDQGLRDDRIRSTHSMRSLCQSSSCIRASRTSARARCHTRRGTLIPWICAKCQTRSRVVEECCCSGEADTVSEKCPQCGAVGKAVSTLTLKQMVKPEFLSLVDKPGFHSCRTATCNVVYFHSDGDRLGKRVCGSGWA